MRAVLDTNVLVSGLLNPYGSSGRLVQVLLGGGLSVCYDTRILAEYGDVLRRPSFGFLPDEVDALLEQIQTRGRLVAPQPLPAALPHADDEKFLEAALAGHAEYLVTHNLKHYPPSKRQGIRVVKPDGFLADYSDDG